jgi:hypothetical protein
MGMQFHGRCHCDNICFVFDASAGLDLLGLRACSCSFCRAHGARTTSDPQGAVSITLNQPALLSRYRFGLGVTDFLVCARCGVFVGAMMEEGGARLITLNANTFRPPPPPDFPLMPMEFGGEDIAARIARRRRKWTPVVTFAEGR